MNHFFKKMKNVLVFVNAHNRFFTAILPYKSNFSGGLYSKIWRFD
jgi:hypothetical protein